MTSDESYLGTPIGFVICAGFTMGSVYPFLAVLDLAPVPINGRVANSEGLYVHPKNEALPFGGITEGAIVAAILSTTFVFIAAFVLSRTEKRSLAFRVASVGITAGIAFVGLMLVDLEFINQLGLESEKRSFSESPLVVFGFILVHIVIMSITPVIYSQSLYPEQFQSKLPVRQRNLLKDGIDQNWKRIRLATTFILIVVIGVTVPFILNSSDAGPLFVFSVTGWISAGPAAWVWFYFKRMEKLESKLLD